MYCPPGGTSPCACCCFRSLALLLVAAQPPEPEWRTAVEYDVLLRPWAYEPKIIRLPAGRPVRLYFVNQSPATWRSARATSSAPRACVRATPISRPRRLSPRAGRAPRRRARRRARPLSCAQLNLAPPPARDERRDRRRISGRAGRGVNFRISPAIGVDRDPACVAGLPGPSSRSRPSGSGNAAARMGGVAKVDPKRSRPAAARPASRSAGPRREQARAAHHPCSSSSIRMRRRRRPCRRTGRSA